MTTKKKILSTKHEALLQRTDIQELKLQGDIQSYLSSKKRCQDTEKDLRFRKLEIAAIRQEIRQIYLELGIAL